MHIGPLLWLPRQLVKRLRRHVRLDRHVVERPRALARRDLHHRRDKGHGVEEPREPHGRGGVEVGLPLVELVHALDEVCKPRGEGRGGGVGHLLPVGRDLVEEERVGQRLHGVRDVERALQTQLELIERPLDLGQELVHALALLQEHDNVRRLLRDARVDVEQREDGGHAVQQVGHGLRHPLVLAPSSPRVTRAPSKLEVGAEEHVGLVCEEANLRVGVEPEEVGGLGGELLADVRDVVAKVAVRKGGEAGDEIHAGEEARVEEDVEVGGVGATVPLVRDVAPVHDLAKDVAEVLPRHVDVARQLVLQHVAALAQVAVVERVGPRPPQEAEAAASQDEGVEGA
mmetsp:Transcript_5350/g.12655  ORF Transcript_5350/g.12655 Transcript_5350/m.12655 type:complete len:343 (-) Transcript_5350:301-1329(-)